MVLFNRTQHNGCSPESESPAAPQRNLESSPRPSGAIQRCIGCLTLICAQMFVRGSCINALLALSVSAIGAAIQGAFSGLKEKDADVIFALRQR